MSTYFSDLSPLIRLLPFCIAQMTFDIFTNLSPLFSPALVKIHSCKEYDLSV